MPRFQCPYHAWIYDLDGKLKQPRHTELLDDFDPAEWGLVPVRVDSWQGIVYVDLSGTAEPLHDFLGDTSRSSSASTWRRCAVRGASTTT